MSAALFFIGSKRGKKKIRTIWKKQKRKEKRIGNNDTSNLVLSSFAMTFVHFSSRTRKKKKKKKTFICFLSLFIFFIQFIIIRWCYSFKYKCKTKSKEKQIRTSIIADNKIMVHDIQHEKRKKNALAFRIFSLKSIHLNICICMYIKREECEQKTLYIYT